MHLVFLTQYFPPEVGAPQARLSELCRHFVQHGHSVTVLTGMPNYPQGKILDGYGGVIRRETSGGIDIIRTFIYPTQKANFIYRLTNYFSFALSSAFLGSFVLPRADYLFVESPPLFLGLSGFWLSRLKRTRMIFNVSDLWPESAVELGVLDKNSFAYQLSARLEKFCYQQAWLITGQSKSIMADIRTRFPDRPTFHLSNGVDTKVFHPDRKTQEASETIGKGKDCIVLYAGLHGLAQGLEQALAAAELLRKEDDLKFVLIGSGPRKNSLVEQARQDNLNNVCFLESRPAREIPALVAAADIILVPLKMYITGAVPSKLYEAMASGRPVILVAGGEAAEIVRDHQTGMVVEPGDVASLVQAIRTLFTQPDLRKTLGENGRRVAEQYFDRTTIAGRFIDHLETCL
ncbi:glycosyltransferase family 4 protein [Candidatus Nitrospira allomarina]|uniref:Glycosyltransferase family 4 protein n=1 Tax=Candidatus Nitrospira allomarina TaxID=3020900 RepID=A0AA96GI30_9BACT|nr:glycosyltransferase family 4 protein [Candidatus Nitrospira allomarina]WNM58121.1 glycosyltransferase family 4 protein [Candidatus Nitrospira allomarina]